MRRRKIPFQQTELLGCLSNCTIVQKIIFSLSLFLTFFLSFTRRNFPLFLNRALPTRLLKKYFFFIHFRIVRNKAAEKAKHVHHQQQSSQQSNNNNSIPHGGASVSVITHAPSVGVPHHTSAHHAVERGTTAYSISGILGIPHPDPNGNIPKRKREEIHAGKYYF